MSTTAASKLVLLIAFMVAALSPVSMATLASGLKYNFYNSSCPKAEDTVRGVVQDLISNDATMGAAFIRLFFHDCFVRGCDASILLDPSTSNPNTEKQAIFLRGYDAVNKIKAAVESICPGVVSCADVLAFAARDSTAASGGFTFGMPSGRRDGLFSVFNEVFENMPSPSFQLEDLLESFNNKGLDATDLVALSGAHSFGQTSCGFVKPRLYPADPTMNATFATALRNVCPQSGGGSIPVNNNLISPDPNKLSNQFYLNVASGQVLFTSDQTLTSRNDTAKMVADNAARPFAFVARFAGAMVKMGSIEVLTGTAGEVRKPRINATALCWYTSRGSPPTYSYHTKCSSGGSYASTIIDPSVLYYSYLASTDWWCTGYSWGERDDQQHWGQCRRWRSRLCGHRVRVRVPDLLLRCRRRAAQGRVLQRHLPSGRGPHHHHRPRLHPHGPRQRARPPPPLLPRLLRQGLRRLGAAGRPDGNPGEPDGGEDGAAQLPEPARLRHHRPRETRRRAPLPRARLLRRHRGLRGPRRVQHHGRDPLRDALRPPRRARLQRVRGARQPAPGQRQPHAARHPLRVQEPHRRPHGHALRRPLHRPLPLLLLRGAPLPADRRLPQRDPRQGPPRGQVPRRHGRARPRRAARLQDAAHARQPVLQEHRHGRRALHLRRGPSDPERHGGARRAVRGEPEGVVAEVRRRHGADGLRRRAHRAARGDQEGVQQSELVPRLTTFSSEPRHRSAHASLLPRTL